MAHLATKVRHVLHAPTLCKLNAPFVSRSGCPCKYGRLLIGNQKQSFSDERKTSTESSYLEKREENHLWSKEAPIARVNEMINEGTIQQKQEDELTISASNQSGIVLNDKRVTEDFTEMNQLIANSPNKKESHLKVKEKSKKQNSILVDGEFVYVVMENIKTNIELKEMFLLEPGRTFRCRYGSLDHRDIVGHLPGKVFLTDEDVPILVKRPSLEEYVLHMKRTATISYPKDCSSMLMMIDASPGDVILEAGTGSGALTLHLSRAVWTEGTVHTYEVNSNHQKVAKKNIKAWQGSYNISHNADSRTWPANICFNTGHLQDTDMDDDSFDGAVIDLEDPHLVLQTVSDKLKRGRAAAIYVSNLSQVIDVTELIRIKQLPLMVEDVIDVTHKHWLVHPARRRQGISALDRLKVLRGSQVSLEESADSKNCSLTDRNTEAYIIDHVPKYITRPRHNQPSFSAFLVKLRKVLLSGLKHRI